MTGSSDPRLDENEGTVQTGKGETTSKAIGLRLGAVLALGMVIGLLLLFIPRLIPSDTPRPAAPRAAGPTGTAAAPCPTRPTSTPLSLPKGTITMHIAGDLGWFNLHGSVRRQGDPDSVPIAGANITYTIVSIVYPEQGPGSTTTVADGTFCTAPVFIHDTDLIRVTASAAGFASQTIEVSGYPGEHRIYDFLLTAAP